MKARLVGSIPRSRGRPRQLALRQMALRQMASRLPSVSSWPTDPSRAKLDLRAVGVGPVPAREADGTHGAAIPGRRARQASREGATRGRSWRREPCGVRPKSKEAEGCPELRYSLPGKVSSLSAMRNPSATRYPNRIHDAEISLSRDRYQKYVNSASMHASLPSHPDASAMLCFSSSVRVSYTASVNSGLRLEKEVKLATQAMNHAKQKRVATTTNHEAASMPGRWKTSGRRVAEMPRMPPVRPKRPVTMAADTDLESDGKG
ncbi:hypothetical protein DFJ74DRAFT_666503 [Hyaloraphidium curvatum]|nr:hypothetical protein DFJ74DRAFT_666503 [Hyaloraphidium curvatum]